MSVPLLVIKVHIFRIISLSIARKQKKYDRIIDISKTRYSTLLVPVHRNRGILTSLIFDGYCIVDGGGGGGRWESSSSTRQFPSTMPMKYILSRTFSERYFQRNYCNGEMLFRSASESCIWPYRIGAFSRRYGNLSGIVQTQPNQITYKYSNVRIFPSLRRILQNTCFMCFEVCDAG